MSGSSLSVVRRCVPPALAWIALSLLPLTSAADPPPHCLAVDGSDGRCMTAASLRLCDADQAQLGHVLVELRVAEQRLALAAGDSLVLSRALRAEAAVVVDLRRELRAARPWLPGYAWALLGGVLGVAASVVLALSL